MLRRSLWKGVSGHTQIKQTGTFSTVSEDVRMKGTSLRSGDVGSSLGFTASQLALGLGQVPLSLLWLPCARLCLCLCLLSLPSLNAFIRAHRLRPFPGEV